MGYLVHITRPDTHLTFSSLELNTGLPNSDLAATSLLSTAALSQFAGRIADYDDSSFLFTPDHFVWRARVSGLGDPLNNHVVATILNMSFEQDLGTPILDLGPASSYTDGLGAALSYDEARIAYTRRDGGTGDYELVLADPDNTNQTVFNLTTGSANSPLVYMPTLPQFSPDNSKVLVKMGNGFDASGSHLYVFDAATGAVVLDMPTPDVNAVLHDFIETAGTLYVGYIYKTSNFLDGDTQSRITLVRVSDGTVFADAYSTSLVYDSDFPRDIGRTIGFSGPTMGVATPPTAFFLDFDFVTSEAVFMKLDGTVVRTAFNSPYDPNGTGGYRSAAYNPADDLWNIGLQYFDQLGPPPSAYDFVNITGDGTTVDSAGTGAYDGSGFAWAHFDGPVILPNNCVPFWTDFFKSDEEDICK